MAFGSGPVWSQEVGAAVRTRPADDRPGHDDARLTELGIHRYESRRLRLYSDIDPAVARTLPPLIDAAYPAWVKYFGELPPAPDGSEFQLTGYLMRDRGLFLDSGLLPEELVDFRHGKHQGYRFWMAEQQYDYYRRHLLIHEATHCFMMIVPSRSRPPLFYLEGMAELFGSHQLENDSSVQFRVMPTDPTREVGFGRIEMIQRAVAAGEPKSFSGAIGLSAAEFARSRSEPYAWSWAVCAFLDTHPDCRDQFRELARVQDGDEFRQRLAELFAPDRDRLSLEWELFVRSLEYGYDIERAAIDWQSGAASDPMEAVPVEVIANRGWQSSGVALRSGRSYDIRATGEVVLAMEPKPWRSEPQGVTIRYSGGVPIGRLTGIVLPDLDTSFDADSPPSPIFSLGSEATIRPERNGVLYLRVNDAWNSLANNQGSYRVEIQPASSAP